jgi:hypothetical protein
VTEHEAMLAHIHAQRAAALEAAMLRMLAESLAPEAVAA